MSEALLLSGKRGQGKSLFAIEKIRRYMSASRMVATNLNLNVENIVGAFNKVRPYRLPDHPRIEDLRALPPGNPDPRNEKKNGLLVLDEAATFLNSRNWDQDKKSRLEIIGWLAQSRKFGWDLVMIAQHPNMIDSQIRESLFEYFGVCVNIENMMIPFLTKASSGVIRFPKVHRVAIRLGSHPKAPLVEHDFFTGKDLYNCYDTLQVINPDIGIQSGGGYYFLSAYEIRGRYLSWWQRMRKVIVLTTLFGFVAGIVFSETRHFIKPFPVQVVAQKQAVIPEFIDGLTAYGSYKSDGKTRVLLSDGRDLFPLSSRQRSSGDWEYEIEPGHWVRGGK